MVELTYYELTERYYKRCVIMAKRRNLCLLLVVSLILTMMVSLGQSAELSSPKLKTEFTDEALSDVSGNDNELNWH